MTTIEIARRLAALGQREEALKAYQLAANQDASPVELLEAAAYILDNGGDYKISYTVFVSLYNAGHFREEILPMITKAFYEPNVRLLKNRYERNCKRLSRYPYLFRKDFPAFEDLPVIFVPYDDNHGYVPFDRRAGRFLDFVNVKNPVVSRNFFADLEKPILADDVYSQYELEYLRDNVRLSEWVGRENHIYLHYSNWEEFCAWLQVLHMKPVLNDEKVVFLIGDEISRYPINFKEEFGIDYGQFPVKPVGIRDITRLIWHVQLSSHNGGDFFNEIFDNHPNLIYMTSIMYDSVEQSAREIYKVISSPSPDVRNFSGWDKRVVNQLLNLKDPTLKDVFVAMFMQSDSSSALDMSSRIAPALFFQPHFHNIVFDHTVFENGDASIESKQLETVRNSALFREFKYIKTFVPLRRFTTSHGATVRFMYDSSEESRRKRLEHKNEGDDRISIVSDAIFERIMNRSFMRAPQDRLYKDSIIVRFEDGKLNPKATFSRLAAFLDLPYTESMTYCSEDGQIDPDGGGGKIDPETGLLWQTIGFDPSSVYKTYDNYINDDERLFIEYFLRDAYRFYGYDFMLYDGREFTEEELLEMTRKFTTLDYYIRKTRGYALTWINKDDKGKKTEMQESERTSEHQSAEDDYLDRFMERLRKQRMDNLHFLTQAKRFVNKNGQPLQMIPMIQPDPALLEQPLYR